MKVLLDTNVLIAAFISRGTCAELLEHIALHHQLITSEFILDELASKLKGKFKFPAGDVDGALRLVRSRAELVAAPPLSKQVCRDRDDDNILSAAIHGKCDCIVSGDKDLLDLKRVEKISILPPCEFWRLEEQSAK